MRLHALIASLCLACAAAGEAPALPPELSAEKWLQANRQLRTVAPEAIPEEPWRAAVAGAAASGIASLIARQQAEENVTGLMVPPMQTKKIERYETRSVPHRRRLVKEPIFEWREVPQLVPKRDEHGYVIGNELQRVKVPGPITGYKEVERLIPDPAGTEMVEIRVPIFSPGGPALWTRGTLGCNGIVLAVLVRAGLGDHPATQRQAEALQGFLRATAMPDATFDLAWCLIGLVQLPPEQERDTLIANLAMKLLDGQCRDGVAAGLWGPVSISADQLAVLLEQLYRLEPEIAKLDQQLGQAKGAQAARLQAERSKLASRRSDIVEQMRACAAQGHRLTAITKPWNPFGQDNDNDAEHRIPGLAYYPYNRQVAGIEDTALALLALAHLKERGRLPAAPRRLVRGVAAPTTASTIALAAKAVLAAQQADGTCTALSLSQTGHLFDQVKSVPLPDVPFTGAHPQLLNPRTLQTSLACAAALRSLQRLAPEAVPAEAAERAERLATHTLTTWRELMGSTRPQRLPWYAGLTFDNAAIKERKGQLLPPAEATGRTKAKPREAAPDPLTRLGTDVPVEGLGTGGSGGCLGLAPHLAAWLRDGWHAQTYRQAVFALLAEQDQNGQWGCQFGNPVSTSTEMALVMEQAALYHLRVLERAEALQDGKAGKGRGEGPQLRTPAMEETHGGDLKAAGTVFSLLVLAEGVQAPLSLEGVAVMPPPPAEGGAAPRSPKEAAAAVQRPNLAFIELLRAMGAVPPPAAAPAAAPAEAAPPADGAAK